MARKLLLIGTLILVADALAFAGWRLSQPATASNTAVRSTALRAEKAVAAPLTWRVVSSFTSRKIQNAYMPVTARGVYLIMDIDATNTSGQDVKLDGNGINLKLAGGEYRLDSNGVSGLELAGRKPLTGIDLGPSSSTTGWVAFDVPRQAISATPELCLDEASCEAQPDD